MINMKKNIMKKKKSKIQTSLRRRRESIETIIGINIFPLTWILEIQNTNVIEYGRSLYLIDRIKDTSIQ